jgi:hypothetical protein
MKNLGICQRKTEITNPELFYKKNNEDYYKYRAEMKKFLDYNYEVIKNRNKLRQKKEIIINPYNPINDNFEHYKSDLSHNPILNPVNYYSFNKLLEKEIDGNKKYGNIMTNNYNINKRYNQSIFSHAGNYLINQ